MKISQILSLTMALSIVSLIRDGLGRSNSLVWVWETDKKLVLPEEQLPVDTQYQASIWPCWLGLWPCHGWGSFGIGRAIFTEDPKQQPLGAEQKASEGPFWSGVSMYSVQIWKRVISTVLPKKQQPVIPAEHASNERRHSSCPCRLGLFPCLTWIRSRGSKAGVTQGPKQQPWYAKLKTLSLPYPLGLLWDYLDQAGKTWLVTYCLTDVCILCLLSIARSLWRKVRRPREQETGQMDSASKGADIPKEEAMHYYDELCEMKSLLLLMDRYVTILQKKCKASAEGRRSTEQGS